MLNPRIIPCLLIQNKALVKTVEFSSPKYVGDPLNAVKIFNEKSVDELIVLDISATTENREPDYKMIANIAMECRMPLCYGGGIKTVEQALEIFKLGIEKVAISSSAVFNPNIIREIANIVGKQSVVTVIDVKKKKFSGKYDMYTHNGKNKSVLPPIEFVKQAEQFGCGEIVINSIDKDGLMSGYDTKIINEIRGAISIPITVLGGAGKLDDFGAIIKEHGVIGVAAGSLFVFKGKYKAVLINYPSKIQKENLFNEYLHLR